MRILYVHDVNFDLIVRNGIIRNGIKVKIFLKSFVRPAWQKLLADLGIEPQPIEQPLDISIPENKMMLAFYLAAPEVENDRRALNTFHGMRRARKEGQWMGPAPIGYTNKVTEDGRKVYLSCRAPSVNNEVGI